MIQSKTEEVPLPERSDPQSRKGDKNAQWAYRNDAWRHAMVTREKVLIGRIRASASRGQNAALANGIGDDCAVLRLAHFNGRPAETLVTTDFSLEGIHFRREWHSPESIGHRCLTRGLSDIAAMGGDPAAAFLSLALPRNLPQGWIDRFLQGLIGLAQVHGITLAGGDTAESPIGILADIVVIGMVPRGKAIFRSGARPGDRIFVSGSLGGSAAAVLRMQTEPRKKLNPDQYPRHFFPEARLLVGRILREKNLASAMIDTSDGLSTDLAHICEESHVGAELHQRSIPRSRVGKPAKQVDLQFALHGGEDYELLFTARSTKKIPSRIAGVPIVEIGRITRGRKMFLIDNSGGKHELPPGGWEHFREP